MTCSLFKCYDMPPTATPILKTELQILVYFGTADGTQSFNSENFNVKQKRIKLPLSCPFILSHVLVILRICIQNGQSTRSLQFLTEQETYRQEHCRSRGPGS
jgi:hypothetical protein